jgi:hypothetical protein
MTSGCLNYPRYIMLCRDRSHLNSLLGRTEVCVEPRLQSPLHLHNITIRAKEEFASTYGYKIQSEDSKAEERRKYDN